MTLKGSTNIAHCNSIVQISHIPLLIWYIKQNFPGNLISISHRASCDRLFNICHRMTWRQVRVQARVWRLPSSPSHNITYKQLHGHTHSPESLMVPPINENVTNIRRLIHHRPSSKRRQTSSSTSRTHQHQPLRTLESSPLEQT